MLILVLGLCVPALWAQRVPREELGRADKLRILVDKVMQPEENWVTKEWIVRETAEAGFNVFSPRRGHENLDEVREVTAWCKQYGLFHIPWMRGTLEAPAGPEADGKRLVWASGNEQSLYSPNADEFWAWTTQYIVEYAKISAQDPTLIGVFLDYENYSPRSEGNCYDLSYDDVILGKFAEARGLELPTLAPNERKPWLVEQGLHDAFAEFQVAHWRERCRALREAVDAYDPGFRFCIYPAPGTPFMVQACYPEWATETAPLILADPWVYGRPSKFLPQDDSLDGNRQKLLTGMRVPQEAGIEFLYSGGIDPIVQGADPEFCGKNAVMISELTAGYWVFYEGPKYKVDHPDYFHWFAWANRHIQEGTFTAWHEPRQEPENWALGVFTDGVRTLKAAPPEVTGRKIEFPKNALRGEHLMFVAAKKGLPVEVVLRNVPVGSYTSLLAWELRDPGLHELLKGQIDHQGTGSVTFTPEADGLYLLGASSGSCAWSVVSSNAPLAALTGDGAGFIFAQERLYFHVPAGVSEFTLTAKGAGAETVRVSVFDPTDAPVATGQTTPAEGATEIRVPVGEYADRTWSLETTRADEGVLEDHKLTLDKQLPPLLAFSPEHVFGLQPGP
jgi:hypothetical protein